MYRNHFWKYINKRFLSLCIQKKIFYLLMVMTVGISISIGCIASLLSHKMLLKNTTDYMGDFLRQYSDNIEYKTRQLYDNTYNLMSDRELLSAFEKANSAAEDYTLEWGRRRVREIGRRYIHRNQGITAFYILDKNGQVYWYVDYTKSMNDNSIDASEAKKIAEEAKRQIGSKQGEKVWFHMEGDSNIYLGRTLFHPDFVRQEQGTAVFVLTPSFFQSGEKDYVIRNNEKIAFYNKQSETLFAEEQLYSIIEQEVDKKKNGGVRLGNLIQGSDEYLELAFARTGAVWDIFYLIPKEKLFEETNLLIIRIVAVVIFAVFISLSVSYYLAGNMTKNLNNLEKNMRKVESGDFHIRIKPESYDEIGLLCMRFNYMADKIDGLVKAAYEDGVARQKLQMQVLKAQINPHFLYNTLGSIKCLANMKNEDDIAEMTSALIELLKASLSKKSEFQTVREEVKGIQSYFSIQRFRYGDSFRVVYELDPELEDCLILDFLLQPLAENALFHGVDLLDGKGVIAIRSRRQDGRMVLSVEDNGVGMSQEKMREILNFDSKKYDGLNSIGVCNVNERIKKYFGAEYGLSYRHAFQGGTVVDIVLPLLYSMEEARKYV